MVSKVAKEMLDAGLAANLAANAEAFRAGTSADNFVTPDAVFGAAVPVTLADGATITPDFGAGFNFKVTLGGNRTLADPTNARPGQSGVVEIYQDGTGGRALSFGPGFVFPGGIAPTLTATAGALDILNYFVLSTGDIYAALTRDVR